MLSFGNPYATGTLAPLCIAIYMTILCLTFKGFPILELWQFRATMPSDISILVSSICSSQLDEGVLQPVAGLSCYARLCCQMLSFGNPYATGTLALQCIAIGTTKCCLTWTGFHFLELWQIRVTMLSDISISVSSICSSQLDEGVLQPVAGLSC